MKSLFDMTPYELGESGQEAAIKYLIMYISKGKTNEKRLAASAISKLSKNYLESCSKAIPFLIDNLGDSHAQVRQYTLKALKNFDIPKKYINIIRAISDKDSAEYNRRAAEELLDLIAPNDSKTFGKAHEDLEKNDSQTSLNQNNFLEKLNINCGIRLTENQKKAVLHKDGAALVLAVPGAGKTTVLLSRTANLIINHGINPASILSITFSKASALDMRNRYFSFFSSMTDIGANFSTIHSFCYELLRKYSSTQGKNYKIIENSDTPMDKRTILRKIYKELNEEVIDDDALDDLSNSICFAKNMMLDSKELTNYSNEICIKNFYDIFNQYENIKKENNYIDFDDMLSLTYEILSSNEEVRERYRDIYKYVQVDEGQDTSKLQHKIIEILVKPSNNIFIVADDDQSIYSFRGAYPKFLLEFKSMYGDAKTYYIEENFRSTPQIVNLANGFIKFNSERFEKNLYTKNPSGNNEKVVIVKDEEEEAEYILRNLNENASNAILFRNNMSCIRVGDILSRKGVSFYLRDYNKFFFKNFVVQDIKALMMLTIDNRDFEGFNRVYYRIKSYISKEIAHKIVLKADSGKNLFEICEEISESEKNAKGILTRFINNMQTIKYKGPWDFIEYMDKDFGYNKYLKENSQKFGYSYDSLRGIVTNLKGLALRCSSLVNFLNRIDELEKILEDSCKKKKSDSLILSTIHSSKGLEFDNVFIIDVIENVIPSRGSLDSFENGDFSPIEEERRLMYVALTRAKKNLHIISLENKNGEPVKQSRFIKEIYNISLRKDG